MLPVDGGYDDLDSAALELGALAGTNAVAGDEGVDQVQPAERGKGGLAALGGIIDSLTVGCGFQRSA